MSWFNEGKLRKKERRADSPNNEKDSSEKEEINNEEYYRLRTLCKNCKMVQIVKIPKGQTAKEFLSKYSCKKCDAYGLFVMTNQDTQTTKTTHEDFFDTCNFDNSLFGDLGYSPVKKGFAMVSFQLPIKTYEKFKEEIWKEPKKWGISDFKVAQSTYPEENKTEEQKKTKNK